MKESNSNIIENEYQTLITQYKDFQDHDYAYYLDMVQQEGTSIFDIPSYYITDEIITSAISAKFTPLYLMTRKEMENAIKSDYIKSNQGHLFKLPISKNENEGKFCNFNNLMTWKYDKYISYTSLEESGLFTFIDFYNAIIKLGICGMDSICYYYLYCGDEIPVIFTEKTSKLTKFILSFDKNNSKLYIKKTTTPKYYRIHERLMQKLDNYYKKNNHLTEYRWEGDPVNGFREFRMFTGCKNYNTFQTFIAEDGACYDLTCHYLISISDKITEFQIPDSVHNISPSCFRNKTSLEVVYFSDTLTLPIAGFYGCINLRSVRFKGNIKESCCSLYVNAASFAECSNLEDFPFELINYSGSFPCGFAKCIKLKEINRDHCKFNAGELRLEESSKFAFYGCSNIKKVPKLTSLANYAFAMCTSIEYLNLEWCTIPRGCFYGCNSLNHVRFNNDWTCSIQEYAFAECSNLKSFNIEGDNNDIKIKECAFESCSSFETITFRKRQEQISAFAFEGCPNLMIDWSYGNYLDRRDTIMAKDYFQPIKDKINAEIASKNKRLEELATEIKKQTYNFINMANSIITSSQVERRNIILECVASYGLSYTKLLCHHISDKCSKFEDFIILGDTFSIIEDSKLYNDEQVRKFLYVLSFYSYINAYRIATSVDKYLVANHLLKLISRSYYIENHEQSFEYNKSYLDETIYFIYYPEIQDTKHPELVNILSSQPDIQAYILQYYFSKHIIWLYQYKNVNINPNVINAYNFAKNTLKRNNLDFNWVKKAANQIILFHIKELKDNSWALRYLDENNLIDNVILELDKNNFSIIYKDISEATCNEFEKQEITNYNPYYNNDLDNYGIDEDNDRRRYTGSYAQDEMGYSDNDIDTIFDGDPDAYWNID